MSGRGFLLGAGYGENEILSNGILRRGERDCKSLIDIGINFVIRKLDNVALNLYSEARSQGAGVVRRSEEPI